MPWPHHANTHICLPSSSSPATLHNGSPQGPPVSTLVLGWLEPAFLPPHAVSCRSAGHSPPPMCRGPGITGKGSKSGQGTMAPMHTNPCMGGETEVGPEGAGLDTGLTPHPSVSASSPTGASWPCPLLPDLQGPANGAYTRGSTCHFHLRPLVTAETPPCGLCPQPSCCRTQDRR